MEAATTTPGFVTARQLADGEPGLRFQRIVGDTYTDFHLEYDESESFNLDEGTEFKYRTRLNTVPTGDVTVRLVPLDLTRIQGTPAGAITVSPGALTFTPENAGTWQEVTVAFPFDDDDEDEEHGLDCLHHDVSGGGYDDVHGYFTTLCFNTFDSFPGVLVGYHFAGEQEPSPLSGLTGRPGRLPSRVYEGRDYDLLFRLRTNPTGNVTVRLSVEDPDTEEASTKIALSTDTLTFTPENGRAWQPVTVTPEDDDTYDRELVNIRYVVSGGDYDDLGGLQPVEVYDPRPGVSRGRLSSMDDSYRTLFRRNLIVEEGSEFIAAFRLHSVPKGNVTVRLVTEDYDVPGTASDKITLSPETLTFTPENAFDWQEVTITAAEDSDYDHEEALIYYQSAGADYRLLPDILFVRVVDPPPAVHISQVGVLLREGDAFQYTVRLLSAPAGPYTVRATSESSRLRITSPAPDPDTGSVELTFTPDNWTEEQTVAIVQEGRLGAGTIFVANVVHDVISDGDFQVAPTLRVGLRGHSRSLVLSGSDFSVERGGVLVYAARLAARPHGSGVTQVQTSEGCGLALEPGTLTFTPDNWRTQQAVTVRIAPDAPLGACSIFHSGFSATAVVTVTGSLAAPLQVQTTVPDIPDLAEGGSFAYTLHVGRTDGTSSPVTVAWSSDNSDVRTSREQHQFNPGGSAVNTIITADPDDDAADDPFRISHQVSGHNILVVSAIAADDDRLGIAASPSSLTLGEDLHQDGEESFYYDGEYQVWLTAQPVYDTDLSRLSDDTSLRSRLEGGSTFTVDDWDQPRTVRLDIGDDDAEDQTGVITHRIDPPDTATEMVEGTVVIRVIDDEPEVLIIDPPVPLRLTEGGSTAYTVQMKVRPVAEITTTIESSDPDAVQVSPASLTFTPLDWSEPKTVMLSAPQDDNYAPESVTIKHVTSFWDVVTNLEVSVDDDDIEPKAVFSGDGCDEVSTQQCVIRDLPEGGSREFDISLDRQPLLDTTVRIDSSSIALSPPSVIFTRENWATPRTFRLTARSHPRLPSWFFPSVRASFQGYDGIIGTLSISIIPDETPPTPVQVRDGLDPAADADFNDGSLTALSASWRFTDETSGPADLEYQYSVGTTCGATDVADWPPTGRTTGWTNLGPEPVFTLTGLSLRTGQRYYVNVRARDLAHNESNPVCSSGQAVRPVLEVSVDPPLIDAGRITVDADRTITLTVTTNAHHGFRALMYRADGDLPDFTGGTYSNPAPWTEAGGDGLAFSPGDCDVNGGSFWSAPGCGGQRRFAPVTRGSPGDVVADHTALVTGATGPVSRAYEILLRAPTSGGSTNDASSTATLIIQVVAEY